MKELVARSYWRSIRRGTRTMEDVPEELRELVRELAVENGDTTWEALGGAPADGGEGAAG